MSERITPPKSANALTKQLRWYLKNCGVSTYRLERETGIHNSALSRFLREERGLSLDNIDILGRYLRLRLVRDER
ncbi:MAG: helix-turn-helix transcriptional regulator [Planctomycetes bacterium]|nr:helix-turn-helix transcriptional regulator [Planctomycetota bacterium]